MPVQRRNFRPGESPRLSQVEPQGAIEFQNKITTSIPWNLQPERHMVVLEDSPSLDYAWAISQISVPIVLSLLMGGAPPEGFYVSAPTLNVKGFVGSQPIFLSPGIVGDTVLLQKTHFSITTYQINLTPFTPYPVRGGQQIVLEFSTNSSPQKVDGFEWDSRMFIGYLPEFIFTEAGTATEANLKPFPGVLSYRYV